MLYFEHRSTGGTLFVLLSYQSILRIIILPEFRLSRLKKPEFIELYFLFVLLMFFLLDYTSKLFLHTFVLKYMSELYAKTRKYLRSHTLIF